jgi:hypothetical protein
MQICERVGRNVENPEAAGVGSDPSDPEAASVGKSRARRGEEE